MADDLRPELGAYGRPIVQSPNIDAFAATGALFENSFVSMSLCAPSRFALFTGLRPDTSGLSLNDVRLDDFRPGLTTMMDQFVAAGYATEAVGKVYHHVNDDANGWTYNFRRKEDYFDKSSDATLDPTRLIDSTYAQQASDRMATLKAGGKPFFLAVGFRRPHMPFLAPPADWARYSRTNLPTPRPRQTGAPPYALLTYENYLYADLASYTKDQYLRPEFSREVNETLTMGYLASVSYVDGLVGNLLRRLQELGLDNNTIVILWGDNGYKLNDYEYWSKGTNADVDIKVPLIVRVPGRTQAGSRIKGIVEAVDIYPTLAELAGLPARSDLEGQSFVRLLQAPATPWKTAAFAQYARSTTDGPRYGYTVRDANFRYTAWLNRGQIVTQELYDLRRDPLELTNVASNGSYRKDLKALDNIRQAGWSPVRAELRRRVGL